MHRGLIAGLSLAFAFAPAVAAAQEEDEDDKFADVVGAYIGANAEGYVKPLAEILGASLNSGFIRAIRPVGPGNGITFRLDLVNGNVFVSESMKTFQATTEGGFHPETTTEAPTIVGDDEPKYVEGTGGLEYVFPAGLNVSRVGLVVPQVTIGGIRGTDLSVRWIGYSIEEVGDLSLLGLGVRHNISQYFNALPVDLAVGGAYHTISFAESLDLTAMLISAQAGITRGVFSLYGGLGFESSSMTVDYAHEDAENGRVNIDVDGANGIRATLGAGLSLAILQLYADYSLGTANVLSLGIGLGK